MIKHASNYSLGLKRFISGFHFLLARPRLWWLGVVPMIIGIIMLVIMFTTFFNYYGDLHGWIVGHMGHLHLDNPDAWWMHVLNVLLWIVDLILQILVVLISIILILLVFYVGTLIISSPFNDMLSEKVEEIVTGEKAPSFSFRRLVRETGHTMWVEFLKGLLFIGVPVILLVMLLIPIVGGPLYLVITITFGMWDLGFTYIDYPMGRKSMGFKDRMRFALKHKWALTGFGAIFIIPFASFFFIAPMAVGGTLLYIDCKKRA
jgi:CysZ protein